MESSIGLHDPKRRANTVRNPDPSPDYDLFVSVPVELYRMTYKRQGTEVQGIGFVF